MSHSNKNLQKWRTSNNNGVNHASLGKWSHFGQYFQAKYFIFTENILFPSLPPASFFIYVPLQQLYSLVGKHGECGATSTAASLQQHPLLQQAPSTTFPLFHAKPRWVSPQSLQLYAHPLQFLYYRIKHKHWEVSGDGRSINLVQVAVQRGPNRWSCPIAASIMARVGSGVLRVTGRNNSFMLALGWLHRWRSWLTG